MQAENQPLTSVIGVAAVGLDEEVGAVAIAAKGEMEDKAETEVSYARVSRTRASKREEQNDNGKRGSGLPSHGASIGKCKLKNRKMTNNI